MTLNPADVQLMQREYPMFSLWASSRDILFLPREAAEDNGSNEKYDLVSKAYILMKRLGQDYNTIMNMPTDERDRLFSMEMELIKEEAKQAEQKK